KPRLSARPRPGIVWLLFRHFPKTVIDNMDDSVALQQARSGMSRRWFVGLSQKFRPPARDTALCNGADFASIVKLQSADGDPTEVMRLLQDCRIHRIEVPGRRIDNLQDLGSRGLLLQRLARLGNEPRILHRDHRLRREILQQYDLLFGEWADFLAICS